MSNYGIIQKRYALRPCTMLYSVLVAMTVITWQISRMGMSGLEIALTVLGCAIIKGALIGDYFMALRGIGNLWRWTIIIWLLVTGGLIALAFMSAA